MGNREALPISNGAEITERSCGNKTTWRCTMMLKNIAKIGAGMMLASGSLALLAMLSFFLYVFSFAIMGMVSG
jgi:hypothetical protein